MTQELQKIIDFGRQNIRNIKYQATHNTTSVWENLLFCILREIFNVKISGSFTLPTITQAARFARVRLHQFHSCRLLLRLSSLRSALARCNIPVLNIVCDGLVCQSHLGRFWAKSRYKEAVIRRTTSRPCAYPPPLPIKLLAWKNRNALRVSPAVTRLTVYRRLQVVGGKTAWYGVVCTTNGENVVAFYRLMSVTGHQATFCSRIASGGKRYRIELSD